MRAKREIKIHHLAVLQITLDMGSQAPGCLHLNALQALLPASLLSERNKFISKVKASSGWIQLGLSPDDKITISKIIDQGNLQVCAVSSPW